ncbi:MAG: hypothetical protein BGO98_04620 [Myxococcales bacterium 68-20]|nr:MAG: hypothetical protein BGO98_04620 [Myxococcales bacterium 68-20]
MNQRTFAEDMQPSVVGRYVLYQPIARGGMATVHAARLVAAEGVSRLVAAKRLHPQYVDDPEFVAMFHDEARIASRIHHPNVVPVLDVILDGDEVILVQEYVHGVPLSYLYKRALRANAPIPMEIVLTVISGVLAGLHAAHEATDEMGEPLGIVHRDVSPQNILVSIDGHARLLDFGIAKARTSIHHTREGFFKGKLAYMAPEQFRVEPVRRTADLYAIGVLLWELVVNRRFYDGQGDAEFVRAVALGSTLSPTQALEAGSEWISAERWAQVYLLEPIIMRAMATAPEARYSSAAEMAAALAEIAPSAPVVDVAAWVRREGAEHLEKRQRILAAGEESASRLGELARVSEDGVRSSGARMRVDAATLDAHPSSVSVSTSPPRSSRRPTVTTSLFDRVASEVRAVVPWAVIACLLVLVGLLAGMMIMRERLTAAIAPPLAEEPSLAISTTNPRDEMVSLPELPPSASLAEEVEVSAPASASALPASTPAPRPAVRTGVFVRSPPARPALRPTAAGIQSKECDPPFTFDGQTKILKPGCF